MNAITMEDLTVIAEKEIWGIEEYQEMLKLLAETNDAPDKFKAIAGKLEAGDEEIKGTAAVKLGIARFILCRFNEALEVLASGTDNKDRRYFQAQCYKNLRQYSKAIEELTRAKEKGCDATEINLEIAEIQALDGDLGAAGKALKKFEAKMGDTAKYHYLRGLISELGGDSDQAGEAYEKALEIDENHTATLFRLAYFHDLHGDEEEAMQLYKRCIAMPPVHANALLNLAVLYEDRGQYEMASSCLRRILATNPNHQRARLFMRDVNASKTMFFDEDQAKRLARHNAVLDIPVTDFELSVRARNCLKKMNIRTLGDLVSTTEAELLGYKNFGETSLKEIKEMLTAKGLKLGHDDEEEGAELGSKPTLRLILDGGGPDEGLMSKPIGQIDFSVRVRKTLQELQIVTLGDLVSMSEVDLLACNNFGQTSLTEVVEVLGKYDLTISEPD